ncbi:MAG TPA: NAD(P)-dependent oxidoreductase, partial [Thermoanaerobaculia bacterium]|nr:NAD(P)-dependent oxidoreductase [Thermoanaerobaculia bacterium]
MTRTNPIIPTTTSFPKGRIEALLLEGIHPSAKGLLEEDGFRVDVLPQALPPEELATRIAQVHLLGVRSKTRVDQGALAAARRLLAIGCFCIGTDQVDLGAAKRRGVPVFNAPFSNTRSVAELVLAEIVLLARRLPERWAGLRRGTWSKSAHGAHEVRGKTLGIVGYGHIGTQVGVLAEALGLRVVFYDIAPRLPMGNNRAASSLAEVLSVADFVTLHVPDTELTRGMIDAPQ